MKNYLMSAAFLALLAAPAYAGDDDRADKRRDGEGDRAAKRQDGDKRT